MEIDEWEKRINAYVAKWNNADQHVSIEEWQRAMSARRPPPSMARHVRPSLRRRLLLRWSVWTYRIIWSHCPRTHADYD